LKRHKRGKGDERYYVKEKERKIVEKYFGTRHVCMRINRVNKQKHAKKRVYSLGSKG